MDFSETSIVNMTLWLLGGFSVLTWCIVLLKLGDWCINWLRNYYFSQEGADGSTGFFDKAKSQQARIHQSASDVVKAMPPQSAMNADQRKEWHELVEKSLHQQLRKEKSTLDAGLGWLASFGSTSPFVGLFGTVWGIMHALQDISAKGSASLEVVAGPIGEALIATAIGIAVAVPAVLAYNLFVRLNKGTMAKLEHVAADNLHGIIQQHLQQQTVTAHGNANAR